MKKFFVSTGLAAISAAGLQSVSAQGLDIVSPKAWSVSGTLRGFYDDNYNIAQTSKGTWGAEVSPSVSVNIPLRQTSLGFRYYYTLYYYNDRDSMHLDPFDQAHQLEFWLDHAINQNWKIKVTDHFAIGQEPELFQNAAGPSTPAVNYRINGDNLANTGNISLDTQWTRNFSTTLSYANNYYDYDNSGASVLAAASPGLGLNLFQALSVPVSSFNGVGVSPGWRQLDGSPSLSGSLDRMEHNISLDFGWTFSPETKISAGYSFNQVNYLGNEPIAVYDYVTGFSPSLPLNGLSGPYDPQNPRSFVYYSNMRDSRSHNLHVALKHQLTANVNLALSVGASYNDSYNDPITHSTSVSPSANASISYTYIPGSYLQLGVSQGENSTDVVRPGTDGSITQYQHSTSVYADLNHRITEKLTGTLIGRFNYSTFEGGAANSESDMAYNVGLNFDYKITRHFSADAGYNFDYLVSGIDGRGFTRNRVYLGLSANY